MVPAMVVEFLTFEVAPDDRQRWLDLEEQHWSRFLERQPGFVRKEMWVPADDESKVHAVIWWESLELWRAVPAHGLAAVAEAMGDDEIEPVCTTYRVVRHC
jgi:uncharacterized protein (TIGR03792 family)